MSTKELYTKGARVWIKDPQTVWKPASVTTDFDGKSLPVEDEAGNAHTISIKEDADLPPLRNPEILIGENDLTSLSYLHEPAVLHNLEVRFVDRNEIYTYCGIVLVAINPYYNLQIYNNDTITAYRGQNMGDLDPHIYAVSEEAFKLMERDGANQSIIVSGESGAGKTVSAKYSMRYFASVGGTGETETQVERRVMASSPIVEAIGNAKTTRNDNSSRFGKYIEIDFSKSFHIIGASMKTYLLEKSRVVFQANDERNYHIFYQMCAAKEEKELLGLSLRESDDFIYTNQGNNPNIDNVDDVTEFGKTHEALKQLGFNDGDIGSIYKIMAAILHLGNVKISPGSGRGDSETSTVRAEDASLPVVASLLEVDEKLLRQWLCNKKVVARNDSYVTPLKAAEASQARDALAKCIYSNLFDWIVFKINKALKTSHKVNKYIGVLDIYGFETIDVNSFEQFCINYANEKLQQQFNQHVFKLEQEEYVKEEIEWKMIDYYDNQPCIELIESKLGVLALLDEECRMPKGSDKSWVDKLYDKCKNWEHFSKPRLSQTAFLVRHFADKVEYECDGFLHKNRDTVMEEQVVILKASRNKLVSDLFLSEGPDTLGAPPARGGKLPPPSAAGNKKAHKKTVGSQFRDSLNLLMDNLNSTNPHYVRCIKPNDAKQAFMFDNTRAVQQLRACGVLETVRISAAGYPSRWTYQDFYVRYRVLCHSKDVKQGDYFTTCENIVARLIPDPDKYQFGKNKLFFRAGQVAYMEKLRSDRLKACGIMIQKNVKMLLYRKKYLRIQAATGTIQRWVRGHTARRKVTDIRRNRAAVKMQAVVRGWLQLKRYQKMRKLAIGLQAQIRAWRARREYGEMRRNKAALTIQTRVRGWLQRKRYQKSLRMIVMAQSAVRRHFAKKELKKLKIEAKSVNHQRELNKGLENKIISLQQRLTEAKEESKSLRSKVEKGAELSGELVKFKKTEEESKIKGNKIKELEEELRSVKAELAHETDEKVDLVTEKVRSEEEWANAQVVHKEEIGKLKEELENSKKLVESSSQIDPEQVSRLESEKTAIHQEYEQERIAYQKLLKDFNRLEMANENLQDEVNILRGGNMHNRTISNVSMTSSIMGEEDMSLRVGEEESAYGSVSGRSSLVSTLDRRDRDRQLESLTVLPENGQQDVGLMMKLQGALKEAHREKEALERKLEDIENSVAGAERQSAEIQKLQELEIENGKLREDMGRLRTTVANLGTEEAGENEAAREMADQFEAMQEELDRRRAECLQLKTVLANVQLSGTVESGEPSSLMSEAGSGHGSAPEAEELLLAYETQKNVIQQLQASLNQERERAVTVEKELRAEVEKVGNLNRDQQAVIQTNMNKAPSNQTEAYMQHELTRLTGENFDLREKIENLNDSVKKLKRQLKTYMKKLQESGVGNIRDMDERVPDSTEADQTLPVILKKEAKFLGMLEYAKEQEEKLLKSIITDLKPRVACQMLPGMPAYIVFMLIRHLDHINDDKNVRSLIQGGISHIKKTIKKRGQTDIELKTLWLSNTLRLLHCLKQYSGEPQFQAESSAKQIEHCLRNFDLSAYRRVLSDIAVWIYQGITKVMEEEVQPGLVVALLEHEGIGGLSGDKPRPMRGRAGSTGNDLDTPTHLDPKEALDGLLTQLTRFHLVLQKHGLDPEIISQIFRQIFYYLCAGSLNNLLLRKDMCHWSRGMQIRYNIAQLEQWARDQNLEDTGSKVIDTLLPIIQATQLLQARKSEEDVPGICDMCDKLRVSQIIKILNLYTPADEFEERVSPAFVRKIQNKLQERAMEEAKNQVTLLMDTKFSFAVRFPFNPSNINFAELEIPQMYNNLPQLVRKV
eukprot:GFUD01010409.1.p1 GENE.GFUD01010409.1~~GFUD01010409.1.p1  ORF type:complete len:1838 (+),score=622.26 GFUD01010409.1:290-5803(+)